MSSRLHQRSEAGALNGVVMALVLVISAVAGLVIGGALRRDQPAELPAMALGDPVERSTTTEVSVPRSVLDLPTTVDTTLPPETTVPVVTEPPETTAAPIPVPEISLGTDGALLRETDEVRIVDPNLQCDEFTREATAGGARGCTPLTVGETQMMWLNNGLNDQFELLIRDGAVEEGDSWRVVLAGQADEQQQPITTDVTGDGRPDLVFSRTAGNDDLKIDVIEVTASDASVVLHLDLPNGRAREAGGQLVVWFSFGEARKLAEVALDRSSGSWQKVSTTVVDQSAVGSSQF
jgi:hypothetical protein